MSSKVPNDPSSIRFDAILKTLQRQMPKLYGRTSSRSSRLIQMTNDPSSKPCKGRTQSLASRLPFTKRSWKAENRPKGRQQHTQPCCRRAILRLQLPVDRGKYIRGQDPNAGIRCESGDRRLHSRTANKECLFRLGKPHTACQEFTELRPANNGTYPTTL